MLLKCNWIQTQLNINLKLTIYQIDIVKLNTQEWTQETI